MPQTPIVQYSFGTFSLTVTLILVALVFCIMFFYVRRKKNDRHVDKKAGDEGED